MGGEVALFGGEVPEPPRLAAGHSALPPRDGAAVERPVNSIGSGGLRHIAPRQAVSATAVSLTKRRRQSTGDGRGKGQCWVQDNPGGCRRRNCWYDHDEPEDTGRDNHGGEFDDGMSDT